jgi:hypothetical protein
MFSHSSAEAALCGPLRCISVNNACSSPVIVGVGPPGVGLGMIVPRAAIAVIVGSKATAVCVTSNAIAVKTTGGRGTSVGSGLGPGVGVAAG